MAVVGGTLPLQTDKGRLIIGKKACVRDLEGGGCKEGRCGGIKGGREGDQYDGWGGRLPSNSFLHNYFLRVLLS